MSTYVLGGERVDSVELKCMVVSRGVKVDNAVYRAMSGTSRLSVNPLCCNSFTLPDGTIVQLTDLGFHLQYLSGALSLNNLKLLRYASELSTPFSIKMAGERRAALFFDGEPVAEIGFQKKTDFFRQKTRRGTPFVGNAVLQGQDWLAFQCLWPCEYAAAGEPCAFCFSGAEFQSLAKRKKPLPPALPAADFLEIVKYALQNGDANSIQITGGSTFSGAAEHAHIAEYMRALREVNLPGELLLYITPPESLELIDEYMALGASRIACSIEVWDEARAKEITPGKLKFTTRERHLNALYTVAEKYGPGKAFSNFIIGLEPIETLSEGATALAERGVIPTASIWMPMGRPVMGTMRAPDVDYYRRAKELFAQLYVKYNLEPAGVCGLNVCMERDIWRYAMGGESACGSC